MSITTDLKNYVDQTVAQLGEVNDTVTDAVNDLRASAEKAINPDALRTAVEPYLAQAREYGTTVTDRAEDLFNGVKDDPRLAKVIDSATAVSAIVIEQVTTYVVKPVQSITGLGQKPAGKSTPKPAKAATTKPAGTRRPSAGKATAKKAPAKTSAARKSSATRSSATKSASTKSASTKSASTKSASTKSTGATS